MQHYRSGRLAVLTAVCLFAVPCFASPPAAPEEGLLAYQDDDGDVAIWLTGRLNLDAAIYSEGDNALANGAEVRRARLGFKARIARNWSAELEADFSDNEAEVKDAWLAYDGLESAEIKIGHHKAPMSLEELTSSKYIPFIERAMINTFAPGRRLGISYTAWGDRWQAAAGLFGSEAGDVDETGEDEDLGVAGRFVFTPVRQEGTVVHFGVSTSIREPDAGSNDRVRFRTRPETHVNRARFLNTGRIPDVDQYSVVGLEAAIQSGRFFFQSEWMEEQVDRTSGVNPSFDGWYAFVSWFATDDHRPYRAQSGEFGKLTPSAKRGAVELLLRFSHLDLNDLAAGIEGGSSDIVTLGMNYYLTERIRLMLNVSSVEQDQFADGDGDYLPSDSFESIQASLQFNL